MILKQSKLEKCLKREDKTRGLNGLSGTESGLATTECEHAGIYLLWDQAMAGFEYPTN